MHCLFAAKNSIYLLELLPNSEHETTFRRRKTLAQKLKKYDLLVSLCSEQTAELCGVVDVINGDQSQANEHKERPTRH